MVNNLKSTSSKDLSKLLIKLNISDFDIIRKKDIYNSNADNIIINLDDKGSGTHWVAMNKSKKLYFDSYGKQCPETVPKDYKFHTKIIEGFDDRDCGQLCCLFLYYANYSNINKFYKLFKSLY